MCTVHDGVLDVAPEGEGAAWSGKVQGIKYKGAKGAAWSGEVQSIKYKGAKGSGVVGWGGAKGRLVGLVR